MWLIDKAEDCMWLIDKVKDCMWLIDKVEDCKRKVIEHRQYAEIAQETGISAGWIGKFATNKIKNPGVLHIQKLDNYFND